MEVPLHRSRYTRSRETFGRYSENSLHSNYLGGYQGKDSQSCITRIPYATLIATIMCCVGVGVFCGTIYKALNLTALMFDSIFHFHVSWLQTLQLIFIIMGCIMGALSIMILFIGFLTTGATRHKVYRAWRARIGGRISCAVYMVISYVLQIFWLLTFCLLIIVTFIFAVFFNLCNGDRVRNDQCIDFTQFDFFFPAGTRREHMEVCREETNSFCNVSVKNALFMFILATGSCALVILSLVHYLMCLSANYAHIRDHEKLQELQELQYLQDTELTTSKDRF